MSVPIPPPDPRDETPPLWRRLISLLPLAIWPVGGFFLLLGSAAGEESPLDQGLPAATKWKRGIAPPPQTSSLAGGGAVSLF